MVALLVQGLKVVRKCKKSALLIRVYFGSLRKNLLRVYLGNPWSRLLTTLYLSGPPGRRRLWLRQCFSVLFTLKHVKFVEGLNRFTSQCYLTFSTKPKLYSIYMSSINFVSCNIFIQDFENINRFQVFKNFILVPAFLSLKPLNNLAWKQF